MAAVAESISSKAGWEVQPDDMVLGFFSFSKFLMYRDLDPECWPAEASLASQPLIRSLLTDGFPYTPDPIPEDAQIDSYIHAQDLLHVADSDSSQSIAVHEARIGRNLVIQGPPGTGKSQTIANIIATAIADGKTVLFVAEKMVALGVVKNRLDRAGVGDACLELHSNKANKRLLLDELRRTWNLGSPRGEFPSTLNFNLQQETDALNLHAAALHQEHSVARLTPYQVIGELTALVRQGRPPVDFELSGVDRWTPDDRQQRESLLDEFAHRVLELGTPNQHPWAGIGLSTMLPTDVERLIRRIREVRTSLARLSTKSDTLARTLGIPGPETANDFATISLLAQRIAEAPELTAAALTAADWQSPASLIELEALLHDGTHAASLTRQLAAALQPEAWNASVEQDEQLMTAFLPVFTTRPDAHSTLRRTVSVLSELLVQTGKLQLQLGIAATAETVRSITRLVQTAESLESAPDASPEAFVASIWDHGIEQAADLADAVATLEKSRAEIGNQLTEGAWDADLVQARQVLASRGSSLLRLVSGEWRTADRLVRSFLADPKLPLPELLSLLDRLALGKKAKAVLQAGDAFGRQAFGSLWRADRSSSAPLSALVAWMRSLGGLGAETRLLAARLPNRKNIGAEARTARRLLAELEPLLSGLLPSLLKVSSDAPSGDDASLSLIHGSLVPLVEAEKRTRSIPSDPSTSIPDRLALLRNLTILQTLRAGIQSKSELGRRAFDEAWSGIHSDWDRLQAATAWVKANPEILSLVAAQSDRKSPKDSAAAIEQEQKFVLAACETLFKDLQVDPKTLSANLLTVEMPQLAQTSTRTLLERMDLWLKHPEELSKWVGYRDCGNRALKSGLSEITQRLADGRLLPSDALPTFAMAYYEALLRQQFTANPELAHFEGQIQNRIVQRFSALDRERIAASALEVVHSHHRRIPPGGGVGPVGVLRGEIAKKTRHLPIRQLMQKAAPAIQALKPVLMMSPLSVAQFLPPGKLTFDLLVMDEASQIQPVDALGAVARCRQVIVVGDERQLPPTRFFAKMTSDIGEADEEEEDPTRVGDIESILGLFIARGLPQRMLRWHYRSRHQSLIAVSNSEFYENRLFIIPSPFTAEAGMGLRFHFVEDAVFYSESKSTEAQFANPVEARAVAEAVIRHAIEHPDLTLGVATFSMKQRRAIQDQLEVLRRLSPDTESFFHGHHTEPFFIKNLENVQGDERDVILISVGYGRDAQGNFAMRFGPLGMEGGERRLNVLISRAKQRCEVFASITDEDIDTERAKGKGIFALKLFLHFARTGRLDMTRSPKTEPSRNTFASQVGAALQQRGYQVHPGVGIAGCFIDLAIVDPATPGRYVLGIECDGPSYENARSARDRNRLRKAVLEDHGWLLHRVWSIDWLHRPQEQLDRLAQTIEEAKTQLATEQAEATQRAGAKLKICTVVRDGQVEMGLSTSTTGQPATAVYVEAALPRPYQTELHETPTGLLADLVYQIVQIEGPVHSDEIVVRLRSIWGLQRSGPRIQLAAERAIQAAIQTQKVVIEEQILSIPGSRPVVRDRSQVSSPGLRRPELLPSQEIQASVLELVKASFGATQDEILRVVSRRFGYASTGAQLRVTILKAIAALESRSTIEKQGELLIVRQPDTSVHHVVH